MISAGSPHDLLTSFMYNKSLMAKKSLNMIEKMMDLNIIDYYIINCAIPSIITIENRYQIDFGKPAYSGRLQIITRFPKRKYRNAQKYNCTISFLSACQGRLLLSLSLLCLC